MQEFKEGDLVKIKEELTMEVGSCPPELFDRAMRVYKITKNEILVEFEGDTYGFYPHELEHTSKLHEQLK